MNRVPNRLQVEAFPLLLEGMKQASLANLLRSGDGTFSDEFLLVLPLAIAGCTEQTQPLSLLSSRKTRETSSVPCGYALA